MFNNINQFGFSIGDYINFKGGLSSMSFTTGAASHGGETSFPVNFGQPVYGNGSNGAAGLNFSLSKSKNNRFFISYLGNGSSRNLSEISDKQYFVPNGAYSVSEMNNQIIRDSTHRINFGLRKMIGEKQNIIVNGDISFNSASNPFNSLSASYLNNDKVNSLARNTGEISSVLSGSADASYLLKISEGKTILKLSGRFSASGSNGDTRFSDTTLYLNPFRLDINNQYINQRSDKNDISRNNFCYPKDNTTVIPRFLFKDSIFGR